MSTMQEKSLAALQARNRIDVLLSSSLEARDEVNVETLEEWLENGKDKSYCCQWTDTTTIIRDADDINDDRIAVEDLDGRRYTGKLHLAKVVQHADRSLSPEDVFDLVRVLRSIVAFVVKRRDPIDFLNVERNQEEPHIVLRVGISYWKPCYYGLGVEACVLRRFVRSQDEKVLCCLSSTKCPLRIKKEDSFYDDLAARIIGKEYPSTRLEFWWWRVEEEGDKAQHIVEKKFKRATASQLMGWGENPRSCLGTSDGAVVSSPVLLALPHVERGVVAIACSARHTLVLTQSRCLYACGDNEDGACGMNATYIVVPKLAPVEWREQDDLPIAIAAGSDVFGAHSAAIGSSSKKLYAWGQGVASGQRAMAPVRLPEQITVRSSDQPLFTSVACGGSFGIALDTQGRAWSWGVWADGRLGLGEPPLVSHQSKRRAAYQLIPRRQPKPPEPWCQLVAGEAHVLAIAVSGRLYSWGRNIHGELGRYANKNGSPGRVHFGNDDSVRVLSVACGPSHSAAIDTAGHLWTWGQTASCNMLSSTTDLMSRRVLDNIPGQQLHVLPRILLEKPSVKAVACGERHTAMIASDDEALLVCGDGLATAASSAQVAERLSEELHDEELFSAVAQDMSVVRTPRLPSANWLPAFESRRIELLACGGQRTVALVAPAAGELVGRALLSAAREAGQAVFLNDRVDNEALTSLRAMGVDCVIVPGGGAPLCAHLMVLAQRCSHFAELIMLERRQDGDDAPVLQLLLPELSPLCADALLDYLYCDDIPRQRNFSLLHELYQTAQRYQLPRLANLCSLLQGTNALLENDQELPSSTLKEALLALVDEKEYADIRLVAREGTTIYAHRAILVLSDYFRAMFSSGMRETIEVRVPDTAVTVKRMLNFLYAGILPQGDTSQLLEDLVSADRYGLDRMKRACESAIMAGGFIVVEEAVATLRLCTHLNAPALRDYAICYFLDRLDQPLASNALHQLLKESENDKSFLKEIIDSLLSKRTHLTGPQPLPSDIVNLIIRRKDDENENILTIQPNTLLLPHAIALGGLSLFCIWLQQFFRLGKRSVAAVNTIFLFVFFFVFWQNRHDDSPSSTENDDDDEDDTIHHHHSVSSST